MCKLLRKLGSKFANYEGSQEESVQIMKVKVFLFTFLHMLTIVTRPVTIDRVVTPKNLCNLSVICKSSSVLFKKSPVQAII